MPFTDILILLGIVAAFLTFGLTLAWGERQTRHLVHAGEPKSADTHEYREMKKAA
jgi:hypothetical protein